MRTPAAATLIATAILSVLAACSSDAPPAEAPRPIRATEISYGATRDVNRYFASVQARHEVDQAFRVGGRVTKRPVDVGQKVKEGDVIAVLDAADYSLSEDAAQRQLDAARTRSRQAEADWERMQALKKDGAVSVSEEEHAKSALETARAAEQAESRRLELARNQVEYTVLRASRTGVVTNVHFQVGQVVAAGQPVVAVAGEGEPEIVVDVPEDRLEQFKKSTFRALVSSSPDVSFEVELRELSAQAAAQTRTYRARLKPERAMQLPLGASATLIAEYVASKDATAALPAAALTQLDGKPAVWAASPVDGKAQVARVNLVAVQVRGYLNDKVLVTGPAEGTIVVSAGVQKMSPGLVVALPSESAPAPTERGAP